MGSSGGYLLAALFVGVIGFGIFTYGRRQRRVPQALAGIGLMVAPYAVESPIWLLAMGAAGLLGLWLAVRAGV